MTEHEGQPMSDTERNLMDWARVLVAGLETLRRESPDDVPSDAEVYEQVTAWMKAQHIVYRSDDGQMRVHPIDWIAQLYGWDGVD
jgi:hypothetical protein